MKEREIGKVFSYFSNVGVAALKLTGSFKVGDKILIKGHTTNFTQKVKSMQINHKEVKSVKPGDDVGIKVIDRVREHDVVYKIPEE